MSHHILIIIDEIFTFRSSIIIQLLENGGAIKDVYVIETSWQTKEILLYPKVMWCDGFKDDSWHLINSFLKWCFQVVGQFFHYQCFQSMLPNRLGKSRASATLIGDKRQLDFAFLKYSSPNISMMHEVNFMHSCAMLAPIFKYSSTQSATIL